MPFRPLVSPAVTLVLLVALLHFLSALPLRPTAWSGPRGSGPFETTPLPKAGWLARDARLCCESFALWRTPGRPLEATAEALAGFHVLLAAARYGVLWLLLRQLGGSGWLAAAGVVAATMPLASGGPRHDESDIGLLLFVVLMALTTAARVRWWVAAGAIPGLFAVWANAHPSALVGLAWLAVVAVGRAVEAWQVRGDPGEPPTWGRLALAVVLGVAAACLNPDGPRLFVDAVLITKNPGMANLPGWHPVDFSKPAGMPWGFFATLAVLFAAQLMSPRVLSPTALLVILAFGFWPLLQQRGLLYWWLIVPWLLIPLVRAAIATRTGSNVGTDLQSVLDGRTDQRSVPTRGWQWLVIGVLAAAVLTTPAAWWLITGRPRTLEGIVSRDTPWQVALELTASGEDAGRHLADLRQTVRAAYPNANYRGAILAGLEQGDFLAWVLDGDNTQPVMLYSRPESLEPRHWAEAMSALEGASDWWETLGRHQVNLVVIDPGKWGKLAERLRNSAAWRTVQDDKQAGGLLVAVRREPKLPTELAP